MSFIEQIEKNRNLFLTYNNSKLERYQQLISNDTAKRVINAIPLLLSVNNNKIPGHIPGEVPCGIVGYEPDQDTVRFIKTRFRTDNLHIHKEHAFIEMLAIMGSIGTIAYTKDSDYDFWVCVNSKATSPKGLAAFKRKVELVQEWVLNEIGNEVHLFVNEIENLKNNIFAEDDKEAFGSTMGAVLKDEFFRSSIVVAGKIPFWWAVPVQVTDVEYEKLFKKLPDAHRKYDFVDIGNIHTIAKEDFLGAALFQLIKALENPFKSILKIGVLEKYLFGNEAFPLLSQRVKATIQREGTIDMHILDAYILMFEEVYKYYSTILEEKSLLKILRQNLYLKINPQLSKYSNPEKTRNLSYGVSVMLHYIREWGWNPGEITSLDSFGSWDYNEMMQYWNLVKKFMLLSYQRIARELPQLNLAQKISDSDFKLISRKIKTNFTSEPNKIENYITFKDTPHESILYIDPINKGIHEVEWKLHKRTVSENKKVYSTTIKTETDLVHLLAWTSINQIFDPTFSRLKIQSGYSRINQNLVVEILTKIHQLFIGKRMYLKKDYMLQSAFKIKNMLIINFNIENASSVQSIYYLSKTSWGESYIYHYTSEVELISALQMILSDGLKMRLPFDDYCIIDTPEPYKKIYKSIIKVFREAYDIVINHDRPHALRIISQLAKTYIVITVDKGKVNVDARPNYINLMATLSLTPLHNVKYTCLGEEIRISILNEFYSSHRENSIRIFYEIQNEYAIAYVINERGNICTFLKHKDLADEMLCYIFSFCRELVGQLNAKNLGAQINDNVFVYKLNIDRFGKYALENKTGFIQDLAVTTWSKHRGVVVEAQRSMGKTTLYTLQFPSGQAIQGANLNELGVRLKGVAKAFKGTFIPAVRSVHFPQVDDKDLQLGTSLYLLEKVKLELILDRSMK